MEKKQKKNNRPDCEKIIQECFWDYRLNSDEILSMARNGTEQEKFFVFTKIIENSQDVLRSLNIFNPSDQKKMLLRYTPPKFNHHFLEKRHNVLKYFLSGQEVDIPELRWNT